MANLSQKAREDRQQKEAAEILKRFDSAYFEIESFKEYEFSQCIAFEMAKRDSELQQTLQRFIQFYQRHRDRITFVPKDPVFFEEAHGYRLHRRAQAIFTYWYQYIEQVFWLKPEDLFYVNGNEITLEMAECYIQLAYNIEDKAYNEKFTTADSEGIDFVSSVDLQNEHYFQENHNLSDDEVVQAFKDYEMDPSDIKANIEIVERFSRPKLSIPPMYNKSIQLDLNLALPKKELLAYIEHIKDEYSKSKEGIKSAVELFGIELFEAGFLESNSNEMYKKDRRKTMTEKCADLFFIYDCNVNNLSMDYTLDHLNQYWNEERNAFPEQFQQKTYKRYLKLAKDFIGNRKYQSLLIGQ